MNPVVFPLFIMGVHEAAVLTAQQEDRDRKYELARAYADYVAKPLLVVGGPYGATGFRRAMNLPAHGFGDVCMDVDPSACDGGAQCVQADIRNIPFPDKYFGAALVSHVLEHLRHAEDCIDAVDELNRVADVVLVAYPTPDSVVASLIPDHFLWLRQEGNILFVEER